MITEIKFENLTAKIDSFGAQLRSLTKDGCELLWQGDKMFWEDTAPVLFPICGGLKDDTYMLDGKRFSLEKHGFASSMEFKAEKVSENCACMTLVSNSETMKKYPYEFVFKAVFTLENNALKIDYITENKTDRVMYYSVGAHEGYNCEDGFENCDIVFNKTESFDTCVLDGGILGRTKDKLLSDGQVFPLKNEYFAIDAIILESPVSDEVSLVNRINGKKITVTIGEFDNLLIWTMPNAPFVCIEPWCGFPDYSDTDGDFTKKNAIQKVEPYCESVKTHIIKV